MLYTRIAVGELDSRITFQSPVIVDGSANSDIVASWSDFAVNVPAKWIDSRGNEVVVAERITHVQTSIAIVRYNANYTRTMRVVKDNVVFRILSLIQYKDSRRGFQELALEMQDNQQPLPGT